MKIKIKKLVSSKLWKAMLKINTKGLLHKIGNQNKLIIRIKKS